MTILIFILVLVALIVVHEFGHFTVAKLFGMRVDEFGLGYPPKAWGTKIGETEYTLNWLPFGGFVKIFGEDPDHAQGAVPAPRSFGSKPKVQQALVLVAGIAMNLFFAYLLITATLLMGTTRALTDEEVVRAPDAMLAVASVLPDSPASRAGVVPGEVIMKTESAGGSYEGPMPQLFTALVGENEAGIPVELTLRSNEETRTVSITPETGVIAASPEKLALGIGLTAVGTITTPWWQAPIDGALYTWGLTKQTAIALVGFFGSIFTFSADLSQVAGPVGIAGAVGDASDNGLASLLTITALISINLALINLLPIPALDGGRLLFVIIEAITRKPIQPSFANAVNGIGFILLIALMLVITASDIFKIVT